MVSHEKCSAGGGHLFAADRIVETERITYVSTCSKCTDVSRYRIFVHGDHFDFLSCDPNDCDGTDAGHKWNYVKRDYNGSSVSMVDGCLCCNGLRSLHFKHHSTVYVGPGGNIIHHEAA